MKILLPVSSFNHLTGAELYVYELGRELVKRGHQVTVAAWRVEGELAKPARLAGIRAFRFTNFPFRETFDVIHASQAAPTQWALGHFPNTPAFCTVHSQFAVENPVKDVRIRHYVCIRPEVQKKIVGQDKILEALTSVVYNPIDFSRFRRTELPEEVHVPRRVLFCGTMDRLRKPTILQLIEWAKEGSRGLTLLGLKADNYDGYIERLPPEVKWVNQTWGVERYVNECDETAGILLGRTTIEGWACGKPGWIFDIDLNGRINGRTLYNPPDDMGRFDSTLVVERLMKIWRDNGVNI